MSTINPQLLAELSKLEAQVSYSAQRLDQKAKALSQMESQLKQGELPNNSAQNLTENLQRSMGNFMVPGNVGDINKVIWPFMFSTDLPLIISPNSNVRSAFTVTQEAAFVCMNYVKTVYSLDDTVVPNQLVYIDPDQYGSGAPGLSYIIRDAVSSREFFNIPQNIDQVGNPRFPFVWPTPQIFLPNSSIEVNFFNNHPTNVYYVTMTFFGYRIRFEGSHRILSTIYG